MPFEPAEKEEQYFQEQELKRRPQQAVEEQARAAEEEKRRLKELHWMRCPKCGQALARDHDACLGFDRFGNEHLKRMFPQLFKAEDEIQAY